MYYIDARSLIQLAVKHGCLTQHTQVNPQTGEEESGILVYIEGVEKPELWTEEYLAHVLMDDFEGESALIEALAEKSVPFERYEGSPADKALKSICKQFQSGGC